MGTIALTRLSPTSVRTATACAAVILMAAGCGSSAHGSGPTKAPTSAQTSTPPSSPVPPGASSPTTAPVSTGPVPITLPSQSPAPVIKRKVARPAGLSKVDGNLCIEAAVPTVTTSILRKAMTDYTQHDEQVNQVGGAAGLLETTLPATRNLRAALVAAKYPADFPVLQNLDELITVESGVLTGYKSGNLTAIPSLYLRLDTASRQYLADGDAAYRAGRDFCR